MTNPGDVRARVAEGRAFRLAEPGRVVSLAGPQLREEDRTPGGTGLDSSNQSALGPGGSMVGGLLQVRRHRSGNAWSLSHKSKTGV